MKTMNSLRTSLLLLALLGGACGTTENHASDHVQVSNGPLAVTDRGGSSHDLDAALAQGRPVALIFWQSWCRSCLEEAPQLARDVEQWRDQIDFFGVVPGPDESVDDAALDTAIEKNGLTHPQVRDRDLALTRRFGVEGTPTIIVLGREREVLYRGHELPQDWGHWAQ